MELIYFYSIYNGVIGDKGFNLHNQFHVHLNDYKTLVLEENPTFIQDFFTENISNIKIFVGDNGSGKTTLLNSILNLINEHNNIAKADNFDFAVIYKHEGKICYYELVNTELSFPASIKKVSESEWFEHLSLISTIYYTQHPDKIYSKNIFDKQNVKSGNSRIDISTYSMLKRSDEIFPTSLKADEGTPFTQQEYYRYLELIANGDLVDIIKVPNFLKIVIGDPQRDYFRSKIEELNYLNETLSVEEPFEEIIRVILVNCLDKIIFNEGEGVIEGNIKPLLQEKDKPKPSLVITLLLKIVHNKNSIEVLNLISRFSEFLHKLPIEHISFHALFLPLEKNAIIETFEKVKSFGLFSNYLNFITLDLVYDRLNIVKYSSGEYSLLNLFSRLFAIRDDLREFNVLLLDEAEISLHPKWQRLFLDLLIRFLQRNFPDKSFQIILASHSPILLSDVPSWGVLKVENNSEIITSNNQTFGANIHDLLAESFAVEGSFMGEFAKTKIQKIIDQLINETSDYTESKQQEIWNTINIIGEPFLKKKLQSMFHSKFNNSEILKIEIAKAKAEVERLENLNKNK